LGIQELADFLLSYRTREGLSQSALAERTGLSNAWFGKLETGTLAGMPKVETLKKISDGLRIPYDQLLQVAGYAPTAPVAPRPQLEIIEGLGTAGYAPTEWEQATMEEAFGLGLGFPTLSEPGFWNTPPDDRRRTFALILQAIEDVKAYYKLNPPGAKPRKKKDGTA
jgi:transcriptional regulator with XRE-family HTH domain